VEDQEKSSGFCGTLYSLRSLKSLNIFPLRSDLLLAMFLLVVFPTLAPLLFIESLVMLADCLHIQCLRSTHGSGILHHEFLEVRWHHPIMLWFRVDTINVLLGFKLTIIGFLKPFVNLTTFFFFASRHFNQTWHGFRWQGIPRSFPQRCQPRSLRN
jgi:hypothetical protein